MNGHTLLENCLSHILHAVSPSADDWSRRFHVINELQAVVGSIESLRGATVEPFGSFVSDLFTRWGDLDISIELQNNSYIPSLGKKQKQSVLVDVLKALRRKGGCHKLQFISYARVPILKFVGSFNISCDISISNLCGQMKSKLLFWINEIDPRFRRLVLLVKEWAKTHNINDSKYGTFNSYSLSLLVVFHFQTLEPAILPPLREIYPGNISDDLQGVRAAAEKRIEDVCAVNIHKIRSNTSRMINRSSLSELFTSFLEKFAMVCSKASSHGVSTYYGRWEEIEGNNPWLPKTYALLVEDPFEQPVNTARTVSANQLIKISEVIEATRMVLVAPNQDHTSLFSTLVRPQILPFRPVNPSGNQATTQSVARAPSNNHSRNGRRLNQNVQRQFQKMKIDKHQNGKTNGPVQASNSQKQQIWRPRSEKVDHIVSNG